MPCLSPSPHNRKSNRVSDQSSVWARIVSRMSIRAPFSIRERRRLKFAPGARIVGRQEGPPEYRSRGGTVIEYLGASLYRVKFDDKEQQECVLSQWLELNEEFPW